MSHLLRHSRSRASAVGGLVLALSLVATPATLAQDAGPEQVVSDLMAALEAKDFESLTGFFCAEHADQAAALDISGLAAGFGADPAVILDALIMDTEIVALEVVSESDTEAVVRLEGSVSTSLDPEKLAPFAEAVLGATGEEVTPEMVEEMIGTLTAGMEPVVIDVSEEVTVTPAEAGGWVICDELGGGEAASPGVSPAAVASPATPMASPEASG